MIKQKVAKYANNRLQKLFLRLYEKATDVRRLKRFKLYGIKDRFK